MCELCEKTKRTYIYEFRNFSYVRGYEPYHYKKLCGDCVYRKRYGNNKWKLMKKEKTLDDM